MSAWTEEEEDTPHATPPPALVDPAAAEEPASVDPAAAEEVAAVDPAAAEEPAAVDPATSAEVLEEGEEERQPEAKRRRTCPGVLENLHSPSSTADVEAAVEDGWRGFSFSFALDAGGMAGIETTPKFGSFNYALGSATETETEADGDGYLDPNLGKDRGESEFKNKNRGLEVGSKGSSTSATAVLENKIGF